MIINDAIQTVDNVFLICIGVADEVEIVVRKRQRERNNSVRFDMASLIAVVDTNGSMQESIFRKVPDQIHQVFILKIAQRLIRALLASDQLFDFLSIFCVENFQKTIGKLG